MTSVSSKRKKHFKTPVGEFVYDYLSPEKFSVGITWEALDDEVHFLIATPEKALADTLSRLAPFSCSEDLEDYLIESLRINSQDLKKMRFPLVQDIADCYQNKNISLLCKILEK